MVSGIWWWYQPFTSRPGTVTRHWNNGSPPTCHVTLEPPHPRTQGPYHWGGVRWRKHWAAPTQADEQLRSEGLPGSLTMYWSSSWRAQNCTNPWITEMHQLSLMIDLDSTQNIAVICTHTHRQTDRQRLLKSTIWLERAQLTTHSYSKTSTSKGICMI
jgi:hypothetical protein